ncbi:hypothetical protein GCM10008107_12260 [Psychrosphaera saromensis]|uniref:DUF2986 domain-containing protein n=1 Tax=Psychrosphaera saromensis TaxID=716813 RepID=A0A2S7UU85_9GAMM|nr:DUF2986 domain-containing protein [Psychrosphaera saromensis]PQJ53517.1 DUF2986 domain-containing protein [Psychrosphaera saromensis]GHB64629.1 hypothetical protein GCM10008107_12260 [Psychrosphaera saromensis]GLQ15729.1 hypothetical protein GCM10007917_31840 [Psychrosphaera saromensis]
MNRKKKINDAFQSKLKKAKQKLHKSNKPKYVSKADRALLEQQEQSSQAETQES